MASPTRPPTGPARQETGPVHPLIILLAIVTGHCICGSSYRITCDAQTANGAAQLWWQVHTGPGHGPATPDQCRAARIAAQRHEDKPCQTDVFSLKP